MAKTGDSRIDDTLASRTSASASAYSASNMTLFVRTIESASTLVRGFAGR